MGIKDIPKLMKLKQEMDKLVIHKDRIFRKIDDEMYLLSKSEKNQDKVESAQRNLAIFIMAELLDSFDESEQKEVLSVFDKVYKG